MMSMATAVTTLDLGDVVQIGDRRYEIVDDRDGGLALEPVVSATAAELRAERGGRGLTAAEFDELFGHLPSDGEG